MRVDKDQATDYHLSEVVNTIERIENNAIAAQDTVDEKILDLIVSWSKVGVLKRQWPLPSNENLVCASYKAFVLTLRLTSLRFGNTRVTIMAHIYNRNTPTESTTAPLIQAVVGLKPVGNYAIQLHYHEDRICCPHCPKSFNTKRALIEHLH
jgi:hypothetical protein